MPDSRTITENPFRPSARADVTEARHLLEARLVRPVVADVLVATGVPDSLALRARSTLLLLPERLRDGHAVVGFASAAWLLTGWCMVAGHPPTTLDLIVTPRRSRAGSEHLRVRQVRLGEHDAMVLPGGCLVTTAVRTAADVARDVPQPLAESALTALNAVHGVEPEAVLHCLTTMGGARGVHRAAALVRAWADGPLAEAG